MQEIFQHWRRKRPHVETEKASEGQFPSWCTPALVVVLAFLVGAKGARKCLECPSPLAFSYVVPYDFIFLAEVSFYGLYVAALVFGFIGHPSFYSYHPLYLVVGSPVRG